MPNASALAGIDGCRAGHPGGWDTNAKRGSWSTELVFDQIPGDARGQTSLAVERDGSARVCEASKGLRCATNAHGAWESVQRDDVALGAPSLVLSAAGWPRVAYIANNAVWLATQEGRSWSRESALGLPPARASSNEGAVVLAIDADDRLYLAYAAEEGTLRYATQSGASWSLEASPLTSKSLPRGLVIDSNRVPHLLFSSAEGQGALLYAIDSDCDGVDGADSDHDGDASIHSGGTDCDDHDPAVNRAAPDPVGDGLDADCNGRDG